MIPARKSERFTRWFAADAERRIRRTFGAVRIRGLERLRGALAAGPVLVVTNHTAWWDPLVALLVGARLCRADAYAMMDAKNLERLPFFGKVGAFGVDLDDPRDGARAIRYAAKLLRGPNRLVWIFAQGREVPITRRPLGFRPGSGQVARVARCAVVPGAVRYELGSEPEPTIWMSFGAPIGESDHERSVTAELDAIDRAVLEGDDDFEAVLAKPRGNGFALAQAALALLTRPRLLR